MTPEQSKKFILNQYKHMKGRAQRREINESCIAPIIDSLCHDAAMKHGIPKFWKDFRPLELHIQLTNF